MKRAVIVLAIVAVALLAIWMFVPKSVTDSIADAFRYAPLESRLAALTSSGSQPSTAANSLAKATATLTPRQRFAAAANYKELYDELSALPDETGEARYFMGRALVACNLFTGYRLEDHEKAIAPTQTNKLEAFREMSRLCEGFYGFKGPGPRALWQEAAAKGYPGAVARLLDQFPISEAETVAARLVESGDPEALGSVLDFLQTRARFSTLEVDGLRATPQVTSEAWRLYVCSRGADCGPFLFEQCWAANQCGAPTIQCYLRDYKPQLYSSVVRLEAEIARAIQNRDWRSLGLGTSGAH
jgi:hypothetical protein